MRKDVRRASAPGQANGILGQSGKSDALSQQQEAASDGSRKNPTVLSPSLAAELGNAMERCQGSKKAEAAAWEMGIDRSTWFERRKDPLSMSVREMLVVLSLDPDPKLNARIRGHLSGMDAAQAIAEEEAGDSYLRIARRTGQRHLFEEGR